MKTFYYSIVGIFLVLALNVNAADSAIKSSFLEACDSSPVIGETSDCICVFNEVVFKFGEEDAKDLIPFITGDEEMDKEISDAINFIVGKCED